MSPACLFVCLFVQHRLDGMRAYLAAATATAAAAVFFVLQRQKVKSEKRQIIRKDTFTGKRQLTRQGVWDRRDWSDKCWGKEKREVGMI